MGIIKRMISEDQLTFLSQEEAQPTVFVKGFAPKIKYKLSLGILKSEKLLSQKLVPSNIATEFSRLGERIISSSSIISNQLMGVGQPIDSNSHNMGNQFSANM